MKKLLNTADIDAQMAVELPNRDLMLITIIVTNVLNNFSFTIDVEDVNVAVQICNQIITNRSDLNCEIVQR